MSANDALGQDFGEVLDDKQQLSEQPYNGLFLNPGNTSGTTNSNDSSDGIEVAQIEEGGVQPTLAVKDLGGQEGSSSENLNTDNPGILQQSDDLSRQLQNGHSGMPGCSCSACAMPEVEVASANDFTDGALGGAQPQSAATLDLSQTFSLHSNADAAHTIYLDFDGHTTTDSSWTQFNGFQDIVTEGYSFQGDANSFTDTELERIQYIWQRVAEDFAPFNVNVTTEDPGVDALQKVGAGDTQWGTRVVIGAGSDWYANAGGVAYLNSFSKGEDEPVFVFSNRLGNGNERYTAEAISHEVGHALGLSHDGQGSTSYYTGHGSGATGWAPILGVGYYQQLTQWSQGEYSGASNTQDDLAIITSRNGFGYREDDHGDTQGTATVLTASTMSINASGIIERNTDLDMFSFYTGAGDVSIDLDPAARGANLDILANLYDSMGQLVASSNPIGALNASFDIALAAGQYFVEVSGTGEGDPANGGYSDYGSLGQYTLTGTVVEADEPPVVVPEVSIQSSAVTKAEGNSGTTAYEFTLSLDQATDQVVSVDVATADGSAIASSGDYVAQSRTVTFNPGNSLTQTFTVLVNGDTTVESNESFAVNLANATNATLGNTTAQGVITNDDVAVDDSPATIRIQDVIVSETSGFADVLVTRAGNVDSAITVDYQMSNKRGKSAAQAGSDYLAGNGSLDFAAGEVSKTISIAVTDDAVKERDEKFFVDLLNPSVNADIVDARGVVTILDDENTNKVGRDRSRKYDRALATVRSILGAESDRLLGSNPAEVAWQRGSRSEDTFVLGDDSGVFFAENGGSDFALIKGFNRKFDSLYLHGNEADYRLVTGSGSSRGKALFHLDGAEEELIAVIKGNRKLTLSDSAIQFLG